MHWSTMSLIWKFLNFYSSLSIFTVLQIPNILYFFLLYLIFFLGAHLQEKSHKCNECGMAFLWGADLRLHVKRVHEGIKFSCKICDKEFKDPKGQKRHLLNVHGGEKIDKLE